MEESLELGSDGYLLYDEANHISSQLQQGEEIEPVYFITLDPKSDLWKLTPKVKEGTWRLACLACVYHSITRATQIKDRLRTITGPLQLLQIWAYSHTAVGRPIRRELDAVRIDFPLFKMWQTALSTHPCSTIIQEMRMLLDTTNGDQDVTGRSSATSESVSRARVEKALTKVDLFLQFGAGSIALMTREQGADVQYEQSMKISRKMHEFREAIKSLKSIEEFNLQACINETDGSGNATAL
ncbi:hypothetical protein MRB53_016001 [Persea americana]|uniref:Uncharacterized protein n=1 Tax=Persea americana TaxID=3435 RepID=A0ACC2M0V4_PERAE|nr:hypothetical protein MRB53_016001 [Persea americana]